MGGELAGLLAGLLAALACRTGMAGLACRGLWLAHVQDRLQCVGVARIKLQPDDRGLQDLFSSLSPIDSRPCPESSTVGRLLVRLRAACMKVLKVIYLVFEQPVWGRWRGMVGRGQRKIGLLRFSVPILLTFR